jgi:hypothetical protein
MSAQELCGAIANLAADLMAARGGTMTAEACDLALSVVKSEAGATTAEQLRQHIAAQGAKVAALEADLEKFRNPRCQRQECVRERASLDLNERHDAMLKTEIGGTSGETLRGAVLRVAKERDHATAEVGSLMRRLAAMTTRATKAEELEDALRAELALLVDERDAANQQRLLAEDRLKPSGQVAEDEETLAEFYGARDSGALSRLAALAQRTQEAEKKAAAYWESVLDREKKLDSAESQLRAIRERLATIVPDDDSPSIARWVVEGDAPAKEVRIVILDMDLACATCQQCTLHRWWPSPDAGPGWRCSECATRASAGRYPCSPTCTHSDAATPGHAERVARASEAFSRSSGLDAGAMPVISEETMAAVRRTITSVDGTLATTGAMLKDWPKDEPTPDETTAHEEGLTKGYDNGVEAMRAACWEAAKEVFARYGIIEHLYQDMKAAIEGAAP